MTRSLLALLAIVLGIAGTARAADWPAERLGPLAAWDAAYDAASGVRFIPTQLVVPSVWDGTRRIDMPATAFLQPSETYWRGPEAWTDPYSGEVVQVYDRRRSNRREGDVVQKVALRKAGDGFGRVYDSRFGEMVCANEVKFPVGEWREGETRRFDYECRQTVRGQVTVKRRASIVTIVALDFPCGAVPHCLSYRWRHIDAESGAVLDHRNYVFTPGRGLSGETRVP